MNRRAFLAASALVLPRLRAAAYKPVFAGQAYVFQQYYGRTKEPLDKHFDEIFQSFRIAGYDRLELTKKCAGLIAWAKERRARRQQNPFVVLPPHGVKTPLDQAHPDQLAASLAGRTGPEEPPRP